jgi:hypothetical protein
MLTVAAHRCPGGIDTACCTPEHEQVVQRPRNTRLRWERERTAADHGGSVLNRVVRRD